MALDPNIALSYRSPKIKSPAEREAEQLRLSVLRGQADEMGSQQAMRQELATLGDLSDPERVASVVQKYDPFKAQEIRSSASSNKTAAEKAALEGEKTRLEMAGKRLDLIAQGAGFVMQNPTYENAVGTIDRMASINVLTPEQAEDAKASIPDTPEGISNWARGHYQSSLSAKDQLPKFEKFDTGGRIQTAAVDPITGKPTVTSVFEKTQTPDNIANNQRMIQEGAANRAVTMRGQNMTDARVRSGAEGGMAQKPLPATVLKMQNEALDKLAVASNINTDLGAIEKQIKDKKLEFGPVSNLVNQGLNMAGMSTEQSRNFATFKSTLEKLRNDSLRLNTGVQTDGDAQRAWNELFQNINDTEFVKQRLGEIRKINERGAALQKVMVENMRSNYNAPQLDYSQYERQPSAINTDRQQVIPRGVDAGTINKPSVSNW